MGHDIDDLADRRTGSSETPGDRLRETFLSDYPKSQWPSFIDEIAVDISADIGIADTQLDSFNFSRETGGFYREGMVAAAGSHSDIEAVLEDAIDESGLGTIVYQLNQLRYEIERAETGLEDVQHALEAVLEKLLTKETGSDFSTQSRQDTGTIADVVMDLFSDDEVAREADTLVSEFESSLNQGLLSLLDEPQMMTPLWEHQLEALAAWQGADYRGYADMATATGKTVLGLAAIALRYGNLHPIDDISGRRDSSSRNRILIVAHSDLILEQWRREFDRHLNIPAERTQGADEIELTWGDVHFRTPQRLTNQERYPYDLVVLDEAHHYATGSDWGSLLDHFDDDVLALSGSVDDAGTDSEALQDQLRAKVGPEIQRYSITEAQQDGVIPAFDWEVRYAPFEADDEFVELSQSIRDQFEAFRERVRAGDVATDRRLRTFDDVRAFSHTTTGKELKRSDAAFRELSTALFSRRTKRWHLAPSLEAICDVVADHRNDHVVVLLDSNAQVREVTERVRERLPSTSVQAATSDESRDSLRDQLDEFDAAEDGGVLVGTGDLLGEGVDIPRANVAVNMATGGVNAQLVQRIGRVLRNPTGDKHAHFYNVVGVPQPSAAIPEQDGRRLIENAAEFCALGDRFENLPGFATAPALDDEHATQLLTAGGEEIESLVATERYDWPSDAAQKNHLEGLLSVLDDTQISDPATILGQWNEYSWYESTTESGDVPANEARPIANVEVTVSTRNGERLEQADVTIDAAVDQEATVVETSDTWTVTLRGDGTATLEASHPDFGTETQSLTVADAPDRLDLVLEAGDLPDRFELTTPESAGSDDRFEVHVVSEDGSPISDASVSLTGTDAVEFARTSSTGTVAVEAAQFGRAVRVAVRHPEYDVCTGELELPTEAALSVTLPNQ